MQNSSSLLLHSKTRFGWATWIRGIFYVRWSDDGKITVMENYKNSSLLLLSKMFGAARTPEEQRWNLIYRLYDFASHRLHWHSSQKIIPLINISSPVEYLATSNNTIQPEEESFGMCPVQTPGTLPHITICKHRNGIWRSVLNPSVYLMELQPRSMSLDFIAFLLHSAQPMLLDEAGEGHI